MSLAKKYLLWSSCIIQILLITSDCVYALSREDKYLYLLNQSKLLARRYDSMEKAIFNIAEYKQACKEIGFTDDYLDVINDVTSEGVVIRNSNYGLIYASWQNNYWTATVNYGGKFYEVNVGTILPGDYKVLDINLNRVVVYGSRQFWKLDFKGMRSVAIGVAII